MKISSIIDTIEAKLINQPSIDEIVNIHFNIKKIQRGDLLISDNLTIDEIKEAISHGAYAVVFEDDSIKLDELDDEIAWIKVTNIKDATIKLLRYALANVHFSSYYVSPVQIEYLKSMSYSSKELIFLDGNLCDDFEKLKSIGRGAFLFGCDDSFMTKIYPMTTSFKFALPKITNLTIHSPFELSFTLKDEKYSHIRVPKIYLNDFVSSILFLKNNEFYKNMSELKDFDYFKPIFINKDKKIVDYGASSKILILQKDSTILEAELRYIFQTLNYAKVISILPLYFKSKFDYEDSFYYEDISEIESIIQSEEYDFAYIFIKDYDEILDKLSVKSTQPSLF